MSKVIRCISLATVIVIGVSLLAAGTAFAHASFVKSDPAPNSAVLTSPSRVTIWFTEPLEASFSQIQVLAADGSSVDRGNSALDSSDPRVLSVDLNPLPNGTYIVAWQVLSTVDGHATSGAFPFTVGQAASSGGFVATTLEVPPVSPFDVIGRGLGYLAQAALVGALAFKFFVWRPALKRAKIEEVDLDANVARRSRLVIRLAIIGVSIAAVLWLLAQLTRGGLTLETFLATRVGRIWLGRAATIVALAMLSGDLVLTQRASRAATIALAWLCGQLLLLTTLTSHSAAVTDPALAMFADWLHLLATSIWIGGLLQMVLVLPVALRGSGADDRAWLLYASVLNFSTLAAFGVGALLISGVYLGVLHVGPPAALFETDYGQTLLFKLALVIPVLLLGAANLLYIKPRLDKAIDEPESRASLTVRRRYKRLVTLEAIVASSIVVVAGLLSVQPRGRDPQPTAAQTAPIELAQPAEEVRVALRIAPARIGLNDYTVTVTDVTGQPVSDASAVSLRFKPIGKSIGTSSVEAAPQGAGSYTANGANISLNGTWQIEIAVRRPNAFDQFAAFRVQAEGDGRIIAPSDQPTRIDNVIRTLDIYGTPIGAGFVALAAFGWMFLALRAAGSRAWAKIALIVPAVVLAPVAVASLVTFMRDTTPTAGLPNPHVPDVESIARGQILYQQKCLACHGPQGRGDGPDGVTLNPRPADFTAGHTEGHPDGDVFYWIQNGFPQSAMPAFKAALPDEDIWHLVNYVRRLSAQAASPQTAAFDATQPLTTTATAEPGSSDPAALQLLERADATMNDLTSLVATQAVRDDAGNEATIVFTYAAPDRRQTQFSTGTTLIQIGSDEFRLEPGGQWTKSQNSLAQKWPAFFFRNYGKIAGDARISGREQIDGREAVIVTFKYLVDDFRMWIDAQTNRFLKYTMDSPDHHMLTTYSNFDSAPLIEPPTLGLGVPPPDRNP
jgi:copper transport protein